MDTVYIFTLQILKCCYIRNLCITDAMTCLWHKWMVFNPIVQLGGRSRVQHAHASNDAHSSFRCKLTRLHVCPPRRTFYSGNSLMPQASIHCGTSCYLLTRRARDSVLTMWLCWPLYVSQSNIPSLHNRNPKAGVARMHLCQPNIGDTKEEKLSGTHFWLHLHHSLKQNTLQVLYWGAFVLTFNKIF